MNLIKKKIIQKIILGISRTSYEKNIANLNNNNNNSNVDEVSNTSVETEIGSFTTTILDKTETRQSNISLTCSKLNNLEINPR